MTQCPLRMTMYMALARLSRTVQMMRTLSFGEGEFVLSFSLTFWNASFLQEVVKLQ